MQQELWQEKAAAAAETAEEAAAAAEGTASAFKDSSSCRMDYRRLLRKNTILALQLKPVVQHYAWGLPASASLVASLARAAAATQLELRCAAGASSPSDAAAAAAASETASATVSAAGAVTAPSGAAPRAAATPAREDGRLYAELWIGSHRSGMNTVLQVFLPSDNDAAAAGEGSSRNTSGGGQSCSRRRRSSGEDSDPSSSEDEFGHSCRTSSGTATNRDSFKRSRDGRSNSSSTCRWIRAGNRLLFVEGISLSDLLCDLASLKGRNVFSFPSPSSSTAPYPPPSAAGAAASAASHMFLPAAGFPQDSSAFAALPVPPAAEAPSSPSPAAAAAKTAACPSPSSGARGAGVVATAAAPPPLPHHSPSSSAVAANQTLISPSASCAADAGAGAAAPATASVNLPFLFKVLSVQQPLSIQLHPSASEAQQLHILDPLHFPDNNGKPEMAVAVGSEFELLCGFRSLKEVAFFCCRVPELLLLLLRCPPPLHSTSSSGGSQGESSKQNNSSCGSHQRSDEEGGDTATGRLFARFSRVVAAAAAAAAAPEREPVPGEGGIGEGGREGGGERVETKKREDSVEEFLSELQEAQRQQLLAAVVKHMWGHPQQTLNELLPPLIARAREFSARGASALPLGQGPQQQGEKQRLQAAEEQQLEAAFAQANVVAARCFEVYGPDVGVVAAYFLNYMKLKNGEAVFTGPGIPHCYLKGHCLECMASSDNVVRGGLTGKYKNLPLLFSLLRFSTNDGAAKILPKPLVVSQKRFAAARKEIDAGGDAGGTAEQAATAGAKQSHGSYSQQQEHQEQQELQRQGKHAPQQKEVGRQDRRGSSLTTGEKRRSQDFLHAAVHASVSAAAASAAAASAAASAAAANCRQVGCCTASAPPPPVSVAPCGAYADHQHSSRKDEQQQQETGEYGGGDSASSLPCRKVAGSGALEESVILTYGEDPQLPRELSRLFVVYVLKLLPGDELLEEECQVLLRESAGLLLVYHAPVECVVEVRQEEEQQQPSSSSRKNKMGCGTNDERGNEKEEKKRSCSCSISLRFGDVFFFPRGASLSFRADSAVTKREREAGMSGDSRCSTVQQQQDPLLTQLLNESERQHVLLAFVSCRHS